MNFEISADLSNKYLFAGGIPFGVASEGIDLDDPGFTCSFDKLGDFSLLGSYSTKRNPVFCGGYYNPRDCFLLEDSGSWTKKSNVFTSPRRYSESVMLSSSTWWITGGEGPLSTTEILFDTLETKPGPSLPHAVKNHCHVKLNQSNVFLIGGQISGPEQYTKKTFTYSWNMKKWTPQANLNEERGAHACGLFKGNIVIASGGYFGPYKTRNSVEILKLNEAVWTWTMGPALEKQTHSHSIVEDDNGDVYILGGSNGVHYNTIYKFALDSWIKQGSLESTRHHGGVLRLPQKLVDRHCQSETKGTLL